MALSGFETWCKHSHTDQEDPSKVYAVVPQLESWQMPRHKWRFVTGLWVFRRVPGQLLSTSSPHKSHRFGNNLDVQSVNCLDVILYRYHYGKGCLRLATRVENNSIVMPPSCYRVLQTPHFLEAPDKEVWKAIEWLRSSGKPCVWGSSQQCQTKQWISLLIGFVYAIPRAARKRHWTTSVRCCKWSFSAHRGTPVDNYAYIAALKKNMSRGSFKLLHVCQC